MTEYSGKQLEELAKAMDRGMKILKEAKELKDFEHFAVTHYSEIYSSRDSRETIYSSIVRAPKNIKAVGVLEKYSGIAPTAAKLVNKIYQAILQLKQETSK